MPGELPLPLPPHVDLGRVGEVWRVDYEARFRDALAWADEHALTPAANDETRIALLVVDAQNTFCTPGFELFVAGRSRTGALEDSRRLCAFLYHHLPLVTETVVTLDTHQAFQIFHAPFLVDASGAHPDPYTLVTVEDVSAGRWRVDPAAADVLGLTDPDEYLGSYVRALAEGGKYDLTIWPFHAMLAGIGHALVSAIEEALFFHAIARRSQTRFEIKGFQPLTEHYSVLGLTDPDEYLGSYVRALIEGGKYDLTIWPFHAMLAGIGHALVSAIEEALFFHAIARRVQTRFEVKGRHPLTEHYSVFGPEVREDAHGRTLGERNTDLIEHLAGCDAVLVAGQAKSHCVAWTIEDLLADRPELASRLYLLEDCTSPVVAGPVDYTEDAHEAFARFAEAGAHVVRSTDPVETWPGPLAAVVSAERAA